MQGIEESANVYVYECVCVCVCVCVCWRIMSRPLQIPKLHLCKMKR